MITSEVTLSIFRKFLSFSTYLQDDSRVLQPKIPEERVPLQQAGHKTNVIAKIEGSIEAH